MPPPGQAIGGWELSEDRVRCYWEGGGREAGSKALAVAFVMPGVSCPIYAAVDIFPGFCLV